MQHADRARARRPRFAHRSGAVAFITGPRKPAFSIAVRYQGRHEIIAFAPPDIHCWPTRTETAETIFESEGASIFVLHMPAIVPSTKPDARPRRARRTFRLHCFALQSAPKLGR